MKNGDGDGGQKEGLRAKRSPRAMGMRTRRKALKKARADDEAARDGDEDDGVKEEEGDGDEIEDHNEGRRQSMRTFKAKITETKWVRPITA